MDVVWKCAITDVSGTSTRPIHPFYVYEMGRPPPPLVLAHWFQGHQKGAPQALILYMGVEKHLFALHCAQETKVFAAAVC